MLKTRIEVVSDRAEIEGIHVNAFGPREGLEIVEVLGELRADETAKPLLSLVAELDGRLVGHVLFTMARLNHGGKEIACRLLAPVAVSSDYQGRGIGGGLIRGGLDQLADSGVALVFVLGHPGYYPKFGFEPAGVRGFEAPYPIPAKNADAWMVCALEAGFIGSVEGRVQCAEAWSRPELWRE